MTPPDIILALVERFERNRAAYRSGHYNETQVRREFIDPFFEALGWDVANRQGYAEAYKDVVHEETLKVGGGTKPGDPVQIVPGRPYPRSAKGMAAGGAAVAVGFTLAWIASG